jgi:hypothetical protein
MQLIEVDRLNAQAAEGRVQRTMEVAPRQSNRIDVLANIEAKVLRIIVSVIKNSSVRRSGSAQPVTKVAVALMGQWRYSLHTEKLTATMQIADRIHSLAQEQNDAAPMIEAYRALAVTAYYSGDFENAQQYATRATQIWRSGNVQSRTEGHQTPGFVCLCYLAGCEWHSGEIASCQATITEAISLVVACI